VNKRIEQLSDAELPTKYGKFRISVWRDNPSGRVHTVLTMGDIKSDGPVLTRVHSECMTGDIFGSLRCDCGEQLAAAMKLIAAEGRGVFIYVNGHEGRGIGIVDKIRAYALQDLGADTVDANIALGLPVDAREYHAAGEILRGLGIAKVRLLTNNPDKQRALSDYVEVAVREPLETTPNEYDIGYLRTKQHRLNQLLHVPDEVKTERPGGKRHG